MKIAASALTVAAITMCSGCSGDGSGVTQAGAGDPSEPYRIALVDGLVVAREGDSGGSGSAAIEGDAVVDARGCWTISIPGYKSFDVVWPGGTTWDSEDHDSVRLRNGLVIRSGAKVKGGGGFTEDTLRSTLSIDPAIHCIGTGRVTFFSLGSPADISVKPQ